MTEPQNASAAPPAPGERAPIDDGMETTAEMRKMMVRSPHRHAPVNRLIRDHDRLTALLAEARAELFQTRKFWSDEVDNVKAAAWNEGYDAGKVDEPAESRAREARARADEREACAKLADESAAEAERLRDKPDPLGRDDLARISRNSWRHTAQGIAAAIRTRGET